MSDYLGMRYARYVGKSNRADRFFGAECGCVFYLERYELHPPGSTPQAEGWHWCAACGDYRGHPEQLNVHGSRIVERAKTATASMYFHAPEATDGIRWQ